MGDGAGGDGAQVRRRVLSADAAEAELLSRFTAHRLFRTIDACAARSTGEFWRRMEGTFGRTGIGSPEEFCRTEQAVLRSRMRFYDRFA